MRYRKLSPSGDYVFGHQQQDFYINSPDAVRQAVQTRLELSLGAWWLDVTDGTPHLTRVLGTGTAASRDPTIQARILLTTGVTSLDAYASHMEGRDFTVQATVNTVYGQAAVNGVL